ncbi:MAG: hypothetical protein ILA04_03190 [Prevotella sp.]|nr:hypothetical protein [Prevotella sp.]
MKKIAFLTLAFMKRSLLVLLPLLGAFSLLTSCSGDDDDPQPEWSFLYGEWMPAGNITYNQKIDGSREFSHSSAFFPSDMRLIFSPSGKVSISHIEEGADLPWKNGDYKYEVKKDKEGNLLLHFNGKEGRLWYVPEEDALYYNINDTLEGKINEDQWWRSVVSKDRVLKRPIAKGSLPVQQRDKNVELMSVSEMPEWMQERVSGESAAYEEGATYFDRPRIHQFIYKGKVCYHIYSHMSSILDLGFFYTDTGEGISFGYYDLFWCTTDWKLIYIFPRN